MEPLSSRPAAFPASLLLLLLLLLVLPEARGDCNPPQPAIGSQQRQEQKDTYPVGTTLTFTCIPGYVFISTTTPPTIECLPDSEWSRFPNFCQANRCFTPPNVRGAVLKPQFVGRNHFTIGSVVTYDCDDGYKRVPHTQNTIRCVKPSQWSKPEEFCKESCPQPPALANAKLKSEFRTLVFFPVGSVLKYDCDERYKHVPGTENFVRCYSTLQWSNPGMFCQESCPSPPILHYGKLKRTFEGLEYFPAGTLVEYDCCQGFKSVPGTANYILCNFDLTWLHPEEFCTVEQCDDPVIEHGIKLTGFRARHIYGNEIAFECNIGYFMIGSYLIRCGEDEVWNPALPSCEKNF